MTSKIRLRVSKRGPRGAMEPEDRVRVDAAITTAETINARIGEATEAAVVATEAAAATDADAQATEAGRQQAVQAAGDAAAARRAAEQERQAAEAAAVAAALRGGVRASIAEGRAAVENGESFAVQAGGVDGLTRLTIYRRLTEITQEPLHQLIAAGEVEAEVAERRGLVRFASIPGYVAILMIGEHSTAIRLRDLDGDVDDFTINRWGERLTPILRIDEFIQRVADEVEARHSLIRTAPLPGIAATIALRVNGELHPSWVSVGPDLGMTPFAARHVAERVAPYLSLSDASIHPRDQWRTPAGQLASVLPDMTRMILAGSSTAEYSAPELRAELARFGVAVFSDTADAGVRGEHTLAQMGVDPALLTVAGGVVPESGSVSVTAANMRATSLLRAFTGHLLGVHGTLSSTSTELIFTRTTPGMATVIPAGTPFLPDMAPRYCGAAGVLNLYKNDMNDVDVVQRAFDGTRRAFDWFSSLVVRVTVRGHFVNTFTAASSRHRDNVLSYNALCQAEWGPAGLYRDLQADLTGPEIWTETGITPTAEDLEQQAMGNKPPSLSIISGGNVDPLHMNNAADLAVARRDVAHWISLGWYKEPVA